MSLLISHTSPLTPLRLNSELVPVTFPSQTPAFGSPMETGLRAALDTYQDDPASQKARSMNRYPNEKESMVWDAEITETQSHAVEPFSFFSQKKSSLDLGMVTGNVS